MKVAELKQVVDSNAVEMRESFAKVEDNFAKVEERFAKVDERFAKVDENFAKIDDNFTDMRREMRAGFAVLERRLEHRIEESRKDMSHQLGVMMEKLMDHVAVVAEQKVEELIDQKISASEARADRKYVKKRN